ncbi:MAG: methylamine utilization protein MauG [Gammaproteobacteria bacterium]|nr:MAG: methylamine utilization protein MauG [Gammaproteobacteria bacterium]
MSDGSDPAPVAPEPEPPVPEPPPAFTTVEALGESLFFDTNLSLNRTQSCATCHDPEHAFVDARLDDNGLIGAVSLGDDGTSLGDRNAPTAMYGALVPDFGEGRHQRFNSQQPDYQGFLGGFFLDGRATKLADQAKGPPLNPIEMGMPDKAAVVARVMENADYVRSFKALFGDTVFDDMDTAYNAMADSIAAFELTEQFAPFQSKYDKSLRGEYTYDPGAKAALGKALFFSQQFTNCATCHQLRPNGSRDEIFSSFEYHNIGVPVNEAIRAVNNTEAGFVDQGLLDNPEVSDPAEAGKFKVPTLRNVAVTGPYMHNGVFRDLQTVIKFYDHFFSNSRFPDNPETGAPWREPEVPETVATVELLDGRRMTQLEVEAMVCFLRTLTDERYEHLLPKDNLDCGI